MRASGIKIKYYDVINKYPGELQSLMKIVSDDNIIAIDIEDGLKNILVKLLYDAVVKHRYYVDIEGNSIKRTLAFDPVYVVLFCSQDVFISNLLKKSIGCCFTNTDDVG